MFIDFILASSVVIIISLLVVFVCAVYIDIYRENCLASPRVMLYTAFFICIVECGRVITEALDMKEEPTAMDVVRGKTDLVVVCREGAPVDTLIVFKDKELKLKTNK